MLFLPECLRRVQVYVMSAHEPREHREDADGKQHKEPHQDRAVAVSYVGGKPKDEAREAVDQYDEQRDDAKRSLGEFDGSAIKLPCHDWRLFFSCDQPGIASDLLARLSETRRSRRPGTRQITAP
jgi:hypothetical protein